MRQDPAPHQPRAQGTGRTGGPRPRQPGHRTDRDAEPVPVGQALDRLVTRLAGDDQQALGAVFLRWEQLVGPALARHVHPQSFRDKVLVVEADSAAWAGELKRLVDGLLEHLREELGEAAPRRVEIRQARSR